MKPFRSDAAWSLGVSVALGVLAGCGSGLSGSETPTAPVISSFTASPVSITAGGSAALTGVFSNGSGVITPGNLAAASGTPVSVTPAATTAYTLTVANSQGAQSTATATVTVVAAPTIASFTASPASITAGQSSQLTASFAGGTGVITPGNLNVTSGTPVSVTPAATTVYTLTVTNSLGAQSALAVTVTVAATAPPSIAGFIAGPTSIAAGEPSELMANFTNGTGVVTPGNLAVSSGTAIRVTPSSTTTYTLTVTNSLGAQVAAEATVTVSAALSQAVSLGTNIGWVNDWDATQMFADAMKQARKFGSLNAPFDESASVDSQGWPTEDAGVIVLSKNLGAWTAGTYALSFTGQAAVSAWDDANVSVGAVTYNSTDNTSTATVTVGAGYQQVALDFSNTMRTPASAVGSGVTNISLMRPMMDGTPHPPGTLFTDRFLNRLKYFSALRMMDYLATDSSTESVWADRPIPADASQQQTPPDASQNVDPQDVTGGCYEYAIQLANQTGKDLWLTIPHLAFGGTYQFTSTTWAANLALLLKYGSDASGNPYTGLNGSTGANPQPASGPVNPGLNAGLHVYVEFSNEFWSGTGSQTTWIRQQAAEAIAASDPDLDWDHDGNVSDVEWRINAKGAMLIANAFAAVYGTSGFGPVYRPVYGGQIANSNTYSGLAYLAAQHGGASQYVWAVAGAPYVDFSGDVSGNTLTGPQIVSEMQSYQAANIPGWIGGLASVAAAYGLTGGMVAYEGGQSTIYQTSGAVAAQTLPAMRGITTGDLDSWFQQSGGPFFYYKLCSDDTWGLAETIGYDIDADAGYSANPASSSEEYPKWGAIKQVATTGQ